MTAPAPLSVLIADDERPALDALAILLAADPRVGPVLRADGAAEALRVLAAEPVDAALLDIHMPGLSGLDLARALGRFERRPAVVFVTADEERALEAFELAAVDYLLKPVRPTRLAATIDRILAHRSGDDPAPAARRDPDADLVTVDSGSAQRVIRRDEVRYVQAQGDYARLHTADGGFLVRIPISELERRWEGAGFLRIHRSYLVALARVQRARLGGEAATVIVDGVELPVSRRLLPGLRRALDELRPRRG